MKKIVDTQPIVDYIMTSDVKINSIIVGQYIATCDKFMVVRSKYETGAIHIVDSGGNLYDGFPTIHSFINDLNNDRHLLFVCDTYKEAFAWMSSGNTN